MNIEYIYLKHYDLIFHAMAYFKVNNASNLYDENYISKMEAEKAGFTYDIARAASTLQEYYNENFERLMIINFLPYYCKDYDEMKNGLLHYQHFTHEDVQVFIKPFIEMLDNESIFFFEYWEKTDTASKSSKPAAENYLQAKLGQYSCIFDYFRKPSKIIFSHSITNNGRGIYDDSYFAACVRYPENEMAYGSTFLQLLHEYTHSFTDGLLNKSINMKDGSHNLSEYVVVMTDYYLIKAIDDSFIPVYFDWISNGCGVEMDEDKFLDMFNIDEHLRAEMMKLIDDILNLRTN